MLLLLVLLGLHTSMQQSLPLGRCDIEQREDVYSTCTSCAAVVTVRCPHSFNKVKGNVSSCDYVVQIGGREKVLQGCQQLCVKSYMYQMCCPDHWGPLCLPCPRWSEKTCNFKGACRYGDQNNGTCVCEENFTGFACQECKNPNAYGENCDKECDCERGVCNKGPEGDGQCWCPPPYTGRRCDQVSVRCTECSAYSYCKGDGADGASCECLPGHRKSSQNTCTSVCSQRDCDVNAECSFQGSKVSCTCKSDYEGDGRICVPRNPCAENNGGCPVDSTVCVFNGPNKSICKCMFGMTPNNGDAKFGCQLVSACLPDTCHPTATCQTGLDGQPRCVCAAGQIGDDHRCYGNLMERLRELDRSGDLRENLTGAVTLFENACAMLLSHNGPFTAFIPLLKTPPSGVNEEALCKNHLILGQHLYKDLKGRDFTMYGGGRLRTKENKRFILMDEPRQPYTVIQEDVPAANGIIHLIDRLITDRQSGRSARDEQFADKTIGEILSKDAKFNRFLSLVDNCGAPPPLRGPGPLTVFVPTNEAVDRARDGSILYMLRNATHKLQELLRNHVFSQAALLVDELAGLPEIRTTANQKLVVNTSDTGEILLGNKGVRLVTTNIVASNGIIHMIDGLLYPSSIIPILPHRCDIIGSRVSMGPCVDCNLLDQIQCPDGSVEARHQAAACFFPASPLSGSHTLGKGCSKFCNTTTTTKECCQGFYGPDCKPCIGGFDHPCYDKGKCLDGIHGNGSCSCNPDFKGIACHLCTDPMKHGENCNEECRCVHGVCDNRPGSRGVCRRGSCVEGYSGENCDKKATPCNSDGAMEHCHFNAHCTRTGFNNVCACKDGYEGDGHSCTPVNLCLKSARGDCDTNAECAYTGPGAVTCVCAEGWTGDGRVCVEINNCQLQSRGGCSLNAECNHIGPGQSQCVCKTGYMGNGIKCVLINPCLKNNGGCHRLAKCSQSEGEAHNCTCPDGYAGDGNICYGSMEDELAMNPKLYSFYFMTQDSAQFSQDLRGNVTLLVPSLKAVRNMTQDDDAFWTNRHHLLHFLRAHVLQGVYALQDLETLVGEKLPTLQPQTQWEVTNTSGEIRIGDAAIITHNLPSTNGYIHTMDKILLPSRSALPPDPPSLMSFLNSTSNYTLFRQNVKVCNLSGELGSSSYTVLLPTDEAVRRHLSRTNSSVLDCDVFRYHVIPKELLFPDHLFDGALKRTLLGKEYQVQFHLNDRNQTLVNDVLLDGTFTETDYSILIVLPEVLKVRRNRCDNPITLQIEGRCSDCDGTPRCSYGYKPVRDQFPANMRPNCKYRKRVGSVRKRVPGCIIKCVRLTTDHSCCPGYYGHECFKCPGEVGSWCSNHGVCQDGNLGNGECRCYEGFHGTACEDCEPGRYGVNCTSKCLCNHGKCDDGLSGSGKCLCYKGWKGASCSIEIKDDACRGVCDENANCITGPNGAAAACVCVAGYEGNGTYCKELDLCSRSNGGCSEFAVCVKVSAGERTCTCTEGYTGDGVVCLEIDGCLVNNGGCDRNADCIRAGPNMWACRCKPGYQEVGRQCYPRNPCNFNNGGCSNYARCIHLGGGQRNCSCYGNHIGDGFTCIGSIDKEILRHTDNRYFSRLIGTSDYGKLYGSGPFTLFAPLGEANDTTINIWKQSGRVQDLIFYHVVACEKLTFSDLKTTQQAVAMSGHTLQFSLQEGSVWINNRSKIVKSDFFTTNGVIHHIDTLLTPYRVEDKLSVQPNVMNLTTAAAVYGYTHFYKLLEGAGLLPMLDLSLHQPYTMFWPTDHALDSMPAERWRWLTSPDHREQLVATLKGHIIRNTRVTAISSPNKFSIYRTLHGSSIKFMCDRTMAGHVLINDNAARVVERHLTFKVGVAYGIDQLLEPPGLGAHCDDMDNRTINSRCGSCSFPPSCSGLSIDTGKKLPCMNVGSRHRHSFRRYDSSFHPFTQVGCKRVCMRRIWKQKCCKNHYGRDCQVCPGGVEAPCGNRGTCHDGFEGFGHCMCNAGFRGTACEKCARSHYGPNCTECDCNRGRCEDGLEGSGDCVCDLGWEGERCQDRVGKTPSRCRGCHVNATCHQRYGCVCKYGFVGNGVECVSVAPPDLCADYNGGCHLNANCTQTGLTVNCTCQSGYQGDGNACEPINRCVEETNGGCSDFATCTFTGPNERQCECISGYTGNGVQCLEKVAPPVDRCLEDNGGCDPVASCKDLHFHASTAGVFHLRSPEGKYKMNFSRAEAACQAEDATLASFKQLGDAQQLGMHRCVAGWFEGGKVGYPTRYPSAKCGENHVGLVIYKEPVDQSSKYDAYCYRLKDVSCSCPANYVGNGDFCHGVLTSVLATYQNFSIFYKFLLDYGSSSPAGQQLVDVLSLRESEVTVFVPHNAGFAQNQTLSARDVEYHISTNQSTRPYDGLRHQEAIASRLGCNLTVTFNSQSSKLVNQRLLVEWDIPAVNGIIHVIEAPLTAPPPPILASASRGHAHSSGTTSTILVMVLLACVLAVLGYYVLKHKNNNFRFHYFRNPDENCSPGGGNKPSLVSIPNPLYSGSRAFAEPFGESSQQGVELTEHEEPPDVLDLDQ